ncbi:M4 family metallopeptidase [Spartinivicinus poritis]|uniref:Neutral metalloproteinase n=1 Tax=Spartinivicinus poritis TaxID=2994640 RepID=A0ABT5UE85_9GAMM|nr:M4 family metallopeptidase [Spartinivicinus sp. A2-2]MDE1464688.1 M4 family metallopeptidase [Spartinivicinus sp. A2-2]
MILINLTPTESNQTIQQLLNLPEDENIQLIRSVNIAKSHRKLRFQQQFHDIPVWDTNITAELNANGELINISGYLLEGIAADIPNPITQLSATEALQLAIQTANIPNNKVAALENQSIKPFIYQDKSGTARLVFRVSFVSHDPQPKRPHYIIDAVSGEVIDSWEGLTHGQATGPGGNEKTGLYEYGIDYGFLVVTDDCQMSNKHVETINLNHKRSGGVIHQFECPRNTVKPINGAYSPLNDAHYFGSVVFAMYNEWFNSSPLSFKLKMRVHYSNGYENAFWDGKQMTFGDGRNLFYPLVSLDVVSHEVSHGFTEQHSNLIYRYQSGGINESFSDIAGEAAEYYMKGSNDWMVGSDIFKRSGALRYFDDPTKDKRSIGHTKDYRKGLDVHYSSGVFNKAFYLLATTPGWNTHKAFEVFVKANQLYWRRSTDFNEGGCGVVTAAKDLTYNADQVEAAFAKVGVNASCVSPNDEVFTLANGKIMPDLTGKQDQKRYYKLNVPFGMHNLQFISWGGTGNANLYVKHKQMPTRHIWDCQATKTDNNEACVIDKPKAGTYYLMLHGRAAYQQVSLVGQYEMRVKNLENTTDYNIPDRDFDGVKSHINIGLGNTVIRARVTVDIKHTAVGDLSIYLISPDNKRHLLKPFSAGDTTENLKQSYDILLADLQQGGTWSLYVKDMLSKEVGYIDSWRLELFDR